jgi:ribosomal protein S18 acetylase RimI-like enzyme
MVDLLVTYLEMTSPPSGPAVSPSITGATIARETLYPAQYLALYRTIGEPLQWDGRLRMPADELRDFLSSPVTHVYILRVDGQAVGLCEFDGVGGPEVELTHFGLIAAFQGQKLGPWLLDRSLREVWSHEPRRVWLHTDTNDHPKAKSTYQRAGFRIYAERMETFPD